MSFGQPPLIPKRAAPPPPVGFSPSPAGAPPPQPSRANRPSFSPQMTSNQSFQTSPSQTRISSVQTANSYSPSPHQTPPQPARNSSRSPVQQTNQHPQQKGSKGFWGNVTKGFSSIVGTNSSPSQSPTNQRNELMSGATVPPRPSQAFKPHNPVTHGNSAAQQQYYTQMAQQMDTSATQQALQSAQNCEAIGMATLEELAKQADGLDRIDRDIETVHLQLDRGDRQIKAIGITGAAKNVMKGDTAHKQNRAVYNAYNNSTSHQVEIDESYAKNYGRSPQVANTVSANDLVKQKLAEQDRQFEELSASLANIQNIAGTAGKETQRQNAQLDKINYRTDQAIHRTHDASYKMQRLM